MDANIRRLQIMMNHILDMQNNVPQHASFEDTSAKTNIITGSSNSAVPHGYTALPQARTIFVPEVHGVFKPTGKHYEVQLTEGHTPTFNVKKMVEILNNGVPQAETNKVLELLEQPIMRVPTANLTKEQYRELVAKQVKFACESGLFSISLLKTNPDELFARMRAFGYANPSVGVKIGVQLVLFGGSIMNLGTKKHHDVYLSKVERLELPGCFAMTEIAHGSNVRKLQTTATYDPQTKEFIINTPDDGAVKWWLGNAQLNAKIATVFARLITKGKDYGIHAFLVPIRDMKTHKALPGIEIGDCGDKAGLHGVDNGFLKFSNVRVSKENLLNRFGDVADDGEYQSEYKSEGRRFAAVLGELITGRMSLILTSLAARKMGALIVTRYSAQRKQFGPNDNVEIPIIDYKSQQLKLMPIIASCFAVEFASRVVVKKYMKIHTTHISDEELADVHAFSAGLKAIVSWQTQKDLQTLREMCGGHGFSAYNKLGPLRDDHDIYQTFEGDNTVLIQQLGGYLLKKFSDQFSGNALTDSVKYLRQQMGMFVVRKNPVMTRLTSEKHLRNPEFLEQIFEYRTAKILQDCAMELNKTKKRMGFFNAWNEQIPNLTKLAQAFVDQFCLEEFMSVVDDTQDESLKQVLKALMDLYALNIVHKHIGDFLDVIKKNKARAIEELVLDICEEVREHAISLVDAFNIQDFLIDAPIGLSKGNYISHILNYAIKRNPYNHSFSVEEASLPTEKKRESLDAKKEDENTDILIMNKLI